eukprot:2341557-Prymnesium_polylepis.1
MALVAREAARRCASMCAAVAWKLGLPEGRSGRAGRQRRRAYVRWACCVWRCVDPHPGAHYLARDHGREEPDPDADGSSEVLSLDIRFRGSDV